MAKKQFIPISKLVTDGLQTRAALNMDVVREYAEAEREGKAVFPPLTVFQDKAGRFMVADGFHRLASARQNGREKISCEVEHGEYADALKFALLANASHGLRRTNADKANAVKMAYQHRKQLGLPDVPSAGLIAEVAAVARSFAENQLASEAGWRSATERTGADGKTRSLPPPPVRPKAQTSAPAPIPPPPVRPPERPAVTVHDESHRDAPPPRKSAPVECQLDKRGKPVPPALSELWNRRGEIAAVAELISKARVAVRDAEAADDQLWAELNFQSVLGHLNQAYEHVSAAVPYCVCPMCQGIKCESCKKRGLMGEFRFKQVVPKDMK